MIERLWDKLNGFTARISYYARKLNTLDTAPLFLSDRSWISRVRELFLLFKFRWYWSQFKRRRDDDEELSESHVERYDIVSDKALHIMERHPQRRRETDKFK